MTARALLVLLVALAGCVPAEELAQEEARASVPGYYETGESATGFTLSRTADDVKTIQLYRSGNEASLPIVTLGSGETLTLEFDLLGEDASRTLSVYFYHADRTWRRDLVPTEYLRGFLSDDIRNQRFSGLSDVRYVHHEYRFPNTNVDFTLSGNYIIRVAEQGNEREPLFERAFFVTEDAAEMDLRFQTGLAAGGSLLQPVVQVRPGTQIADAQVFDFNACFARNGRVERMRCAPEPRLIDLALYQFYLPREEAFEGEGPYFEVDMGLLQVGPEIAEVDRSASPFEVELDVDYARFGSDLQPDALIGQPVIATVFRGGGQADTDGEYVQTRFQFVPPDERELRGTVILTGAFNNWQVDPANTLVWDAASGRYTTSVLLKQGAYLYRYVLDDPSLLPSRGFDFQPTLYTAFVYLYDAVKLTDRLVGVRSAIGQ